MEFGLINIWAVLVATIVNVILGMVWYSPNVLGDTWADALHLSKMPAKANLKPSVWHYVGAFFVSLVTMWVLAVLINSLHLNTVAQGVLFAFLVWLGFIATSHFSGVIWVGKPMVAYLIDVGYYLVSFMVASIILTLWR
jgi:hypothetical protein